MKKYNMNNVKGEVIKALAKRMDKAAIRGKWTSYWGKPAPMDVDAIVAEVCDEIGIEHE